MKLGMNRRALLLLALLLFVGADLLLLRHRAAREVAAEQAAAQAAAPPRDGVPAPDEVRLTPTALETVPASPWLERRKRRYAALFKDTQCELLVVPVQVEAGAFDRPNRYIMSADLAAALAAGGKCVADPYLVDITLDDAFRRRDAGEVQALARSMHAQRIVNVYAGHTAPGHMRITVQVQGADGSTTAAHSFEQYAYDDAHPPFAVFREHLPEMLAAVGLSTAVAQAVPAGTMPEHLPDSFAHYLRPARAQHAAPLQQAADLALLAMLAPYTEWPAGDRLLSKAWAALEPADGTDPAVRRLRARLLFHLRERPLALAQIKDDSGPEAEGLRAVLNGNLPQARAALAQVKQPWEQAFLGLEVHDLELFYSRDSRASAAQVQALFEGSAFAPFVERRLKDNDAWSLGTTIMFKRPLDSELPIPGLAITEAIDNSLMALFDRPELELAALRQVHRLVEEQPRLWCCSSFSPAPAAADLLDLLDSRIEHTLGRQAYYYVNPQGRYSAALEVLRHYDSELGGSPCTEELRAIIYWSLLQQGEVDKRKDYTDKMHQAARLSAWLNQAQTVDEGSDFWYMNQEPQDPLLGTLVRVTDDYPARPYWEWNLHRSTAAERLPYSSDQIGALQDLLRDARPEQQAQYLAELDTRFIGGPEATRLHLEHIPAERKTPELLQQEIARDPDNWDLRNALGWLLLDRESFAQVKDAVLAYPPFHEQDPDDVVKLSNYASNWGHDLLYLGAVEQARPLLERSADYRTGSAGSTLAAARVALLDHRYGLAAEAFAEVGQHYNNFVAWRELDTQLFAAGRDEAAWSLFDSTTSRYQNDGFWTAAMVGHRRAALDDAALGRWYAERLGKARSAEDRNNLRACAFLEWLVDRAPTQAFVDAMQATGTPGEAVVRGGKTWLDHTSPGVTIELGPFDLRKEPLKPGAALPDRYALGAQALLAVRQGQYAQAVELFDRYGTFYGFENTDQHLLLPWFALAAAKSGDTLKLRAFLEQLPPERQLYETRLARAVFDALAGQRDEALALIGKDFHRWAYVYGDHFPNSAWSYLAVCALLYEQTHDEAYRQAALRLARVLRNLEPAFAYGHAVVAYLGDNERERAEAEGMALYLDPRSEWAAKAPAAVQAAGRAWLKQHPSPFGADDGWGWMGHGEE